MDGEQTEIDIVAPLVNGGVLTGSVKWNRRPFGAGLLEKHVQAIDRLARSGNRWAHEARDPESPLLFVAAGGFSAAFEQAVQLSGRKVMYWSLADLYVKGKKRVVK